MNSIEIRQKRADLVAQTKAWFDSVTDVTAEVEAEWQRRNTDIDRLDAEAKSAEKRERLDHLQAELAQPAPKRAAPSTRFTAPTKNERGRLLKTWLGYGQPLKNQPHVDGDVMNRCAEAGYHLGSNSIELRSMNTSTGGAGGNTVFTTTYPELQTEMKYFSPILGKVNVIPTSDGNNFVLPRGTDVANTMAIVSQTSGSGTTTDPTFDKVTLGSYYFRYIELITYEMLEDAVFDVEGWITSRLNERAARTLEKYIVSGTGSSQPTGLVAACTAADGGTPAVTLASGHSTFYQFEDLFDCFKAVDLAYRPANTLVLNDQSLWALRKVKDSQGRFIWDVNNTLVQNSQPDKIAGFNYLISNSIDAPAFSKNLAVFADLSRYVVRMVDSIRITRLNELYRANGMIGFEVLMRWDGNYVGHASSIARVATPAS